MRSEIDDRSNRSLVNKGFELRPVVSTQPKFRAITHEYGVVAVVGSLHPINVIQVYKEGAMNPQKSRWIEHQFNVLQRLPHQLCLGTGLDFNEVALSFDPYDV